PPRLAAEAGLRRKRHVRALDRQAVPRRRAPAFGAGQNDRRKQLGPQIELLYIRAVGEQATTLLVDGRVRNNQQRADIRLHGSSSLDSVGCANNCRCWPVSSS